MIWCDTFKLKKKKKNTQNEAFELNFVFKLQVTDLAKTSNDMS